MSALTKFPYWRELLLRSHQKVEQHQELSKPGQRNSLSQKGYRLRKRACVIEQELCKHELGNLGKLCVAAVETYGRNSHPSDTERWECFRKFAGGPLRVPLRVSDHTYYCSGPPH